MKQRALRRLCGCLAAGILLASCLTGCGKTEPDSVAAETAETPVPSEKQETAHIHSYEAETVEMTCIADGYTEYRCYCGDSYTGAVKTAQGHSYVDEVVTPTIAAEGFTRHTCSVCGDTYEDSVVPMLADGIEDGSFFSDAVFVGDSIINTLKVYAQVESCFGGAPFLCRPSYGMRHAAENLMDLSYRGKAYGMVDALVACEPKKIFIQLCMNDIATVGPDLAITYWETMIPQIQEACPDALIFIQSATPTYVEVGKLTNANIAAFNVLLESFAEKHGCFYIDIAAPFKDENGFLKKEYCEDEYCHLTVAACGIWERTLKDYLLEHKGEFA